MVDYVDVEAGLRIAFEVDAALELKLPVCQGAKVHVSAVQDTVEVYCLHKGFQFDMALTADFSVKGVGKGFLPCKLLCGMLIGLLLRTDGFKPSPVGVDACAQLLCHVLLNLFFLLQALQQLLFVQYQKNY